MLCSEDARQLSSIADKAKKSKKCNVLIDLFPQSSLCCSTLHQESDDPPLVRSFLFEFLQLCVDNALLLLEFTFESFGRFSRFLDKIRQVGLEGRSMSSLFLESSREGVDFGFESRDFFVDRQIESTTG